MIPRSIRETVAAELRRTNFAGRTVSLAEGVLVDAGVIALAAARGRRRDAAILGGVGALGLLDDLIEHRARAAGRPVAKGLRGHLGALRHGRLTTGGAKALGIPALCLVGAAISSPPRTGAGRVLGDAVLAAGTANLANLLDLRPGRALKAMIALGALPALCPAPGSAPGPVTGPAGGAGGPRATRAAEGARDADRSRAGRDLALAALAPAVLALPADLAERGMLGDAGANLLGAAVGTAIARRAPGPLRIAALVAVIALTLASERVSFSAVIARTPVLSALDAWGRRPADAAGSTA